MSALIAKLFTVVVVSPLVMLALYACLKPAMPFSHFPVTLGFAPVVLVIVSAAGLAFYFIKQSINGLAAIIGAPIVAAVTLYLSMLLTFNVMGS